MPPSALEVEIHITTFPAPQGRRGDAEVDQLVLRYASSPSSAVSSFGDIQHWPTTRGPNEGKLANWIGSHFVEHRTETPDTIHS